jgi:hypothetical protein
MPTSYPTFTGRMGFEYGQWKLQLMPTLPKMQSEAGKTMYKGDLFLEYLTLTCFPQQSAAHRWWAHNSSQLLDPSTLPPGQLLLERFFRAMQLKFEVITMHDAMVFLKDTSNLMTDAEDPEAFHGRVSTKLEAIPTDIVPQIQKVDHFQSWLHPAILQSCDAAFGQLHREGKWTIEDVLSIAQQEYLRRAAKTVPVMQALIQHQQGVPDVRSKHQAAAHASVAREEPVFEPGNQAAEIAELEAHIATQDAYIVEQDSTIAGLEAHVAQLEQALASANLCLAKAQQASGVFTPHDGPEASQQSQVRLISDMFRDSYH